MHPSCPLRVARALEPLQLRKRSRADGNFGLSVDPLPVCKRAHGIQRLTQCVRRDGRHADRSKSGRRLAPIVESSATW
jgi:hypothetical protein